MRVCKGNGSECVLSNFASPFLYFSLLNFLLVTRLHELVPFMGQFELAKLCLVAIYVCAFWQLLKKDSSFAQIFCFSSIPLFFFLALIVVRIPFGPHGDVALSEFLFLFGNILGVVGLLLIEPRPSERSLVLFSIICGSFVLGGQVVFRILSSGFAADMRPVLNHANSDPNLTAWMVGMSVPLVLFATSQSLRGKTFASQWHFKVIHVFSALVVLVLFASLYLTFSRSALVCLFLALIPLAFSGRRAFVGTSTALVLGLTLMSANPTGSKRMEMMNVLETKKIRESDPAYVFRLKSIDTGVEVFLQSPFFGEGFAEVPFVVHRFDGLGATRHHESFAPHNAWVYLAAENGLFGLMLVASPFVLALRNVFLRLRQQWCCSYGRFEIACLGSFLCFCIAMLATLPLPYSYPTFLGPFVCLFFLPKVQI